MTAGSFPRGSSVHVALAFSACLSFAAPALAADTPAKPTFSKDVAPIFQAKCQACHQPNSIAPMSLITYRGSAAVGAVDQGARRARARCRRGTSTAASASRSSRTTCRSPTSRSTRSSAGSTPGAPQGDPKDMPPPKPLVTDNEWQGVRDGFGPPDLVVKSSEYTMPAVAPGRLVAADERHPAHRAALGADGRDSSDQPEGPQDHASLDRVPRAEQRSRRGQHRHRRTARSAAAAPTISSTAVRS